MLANLNSSFDFHAKALVIRSERQRVIASNIANVDTPGYKAHNIDFKDAMNAAMGTSANALPMAQSRSALSADTRLGTSPGHMALAGNSTGQLGGKQQVGYSIQSQPSLDNNSVDLDQERANFADNSVRYEATLRFINSQSKTILSAIQGQ
jgi:flagellar basal-body rod protein FlgB